VRVFNVGNTITKALPSFNPPSNADFNLYDSAGGLVPAAERGTLTGTAQWSVNGTKSAAGHYNVGSWSVAYQAGLTSDLGYSLTNYAGNQLLVNSRQLTVTANSDAKFVTRTDAPGYAGVSYTNFAPGENASVLTGTLGISRTNAGVNTASTYNGVLQPSGYATGGNYSFTYVNGNFTIVPADQLLVRYANTNSVYGSTPAYSISSAQYLFSGTNEVVDLTASTTLNPANNLVTVLDGASGQATFTAGPLTPSLSTSGQLKAGNYALSGSSITETSPNFSNIITFVGTHAVTPKRLDISGLTATKVYDGLTTVSLSGPGSLNGVIGTDAVTIGGTTAASFSDKNVGTGKTITVQGIALSGADAANYAVYNVTASGSITAKPIDVYGLTANGKVYDGTTTATLSGAATVYGNSTTASDGLFVGSETVSLSGTAAGSFASKTVGTAKPVSVTGLSLSGADAGNYTLRGANATLTADITPKPLDVSGLSATKTYDGLTGASLTGTAGLTGGGTTSSDGKYITGDTVSLSGSASATYADPNAGNNKPLTLAGLNLAGSDAGNYTLNINSSTGVILKAPLTVRANDDAKFVTQSDSAGFNGVSYSGFVNGESSAVLGGTLAIVRSNATTNTAGTYSGVLTPSGLSASNYEISYANGNFTIVPASQLLVRVANATSTYGSAASYSVTSAQYLDGSNVIQTLAAPSVAGNTFTYSDGAGGSAVFTLGPTNAQNSTSGNLKAGNYAIGASNISETSANFSNTITVVGNQAVTQKPLTAGGLTASKVYDGTRLASLSGTQTLAGAVSGDDLSLSVSSASYDTKDVGTGKAVEITGLSLSGNDAGNYYLASSGAVTGTITQATLTVTPSNQSRVYGDANPTLVQAITGFVAGESSNTAGITGLAGFGSTTATTSSGVGTYTITGSTGSLASPNYSFSASNGVLTINKATLDTHSR